MARPRRRSSSPSKSKRDAAASVLLLAATPLLVGGAIALTVAVSTARSPLGSWVRALLGGPSPSRTRLIRDALVGFARGTKTFPALRDAVLGSAKGSVAAVLGPPRTALLGRGFGKLSIWRADTWYYPLDRADRSALAIRFEGGVAREVDRISVPTAMIE